MDKWLSVVGIGDDGLAGLSPVAMSHLQQARLIVGGKRHLAMLADDKLEGDDRPQIAWSGPIADTITQILTHRPTPTCILASGDPMCYGIGTTLMRHLPLTEMTIFPAPSAFSLACSRLGWPLPEVETISLCGRDPALLNAVMYPGAKILVLSSDRTTPATVANCLIEKGYGNTQMTVLEHLGGPQERQIQGLARDWTHTDMQNLNTIALECPPDVLGFTRFPGLPDDAYQHDGQLTKREVRAITLSTLAPKPGELLWDVGGGSGSISIEWMRHHHRCQAITIESHPERLRTIAHNAANLGVPNLQIIDGRAPAALQNRPTPDAIFIGGGLTVEGVFETCWATLKPGGRLVANGFTVQTEQRLFELQQIYGGELNRIAIQRAQPIGKFLGWKSLAPVTQWCVTKLQ
ncbi:precorrin-6y C5,15-methyltransferase (decarboxylating) subunit CbiE [filamentous cyanobacterium LEGE 11480]|uniref:Precorrin-6y C5,15-methyltransferase (Decarboxylating) subunit CbiE n=1 Tax=Romeriopsis navalis LEGE 11480 TaxID=2777977 RepID=A0A928Z331_9CYAN|nr:precorrin-6y C5,15-methyltransferase (decarboxylating) subunit CbiE [Romeriopsis navalis]MBE9030214.1 precorrin-6y C5,15-methyltransferase (decarboxylating) subunit CbiE [Romeriopsis navalis LEGE 11480]